MPRSHYPLNASEYSLHSPFQVGLAEMRAAVEGSGGAMVLCDTADSDAFKRSMWKLTGTYGQMHTSQVRHGKKDRMKKGARISQASEHLWKLTGTYGQMHT